MEADEALGVGELRADLLDGQRRGVGREDRVLGDDLLDLAEHLLLDADLFEHGLDHEVAVRVEALVGGAGDERPQLVGRVAVEAPLGLELADLLVDVGDALVDASLVEVGDEHGHLQLAHEQQRELAGHEAGADDADLRHLLRESLVGRTHRTLRPLLDEVERVHGCRELVARDEIGERLVLAGEALLLRAALRLVEQVERDVRRPGHGADLRLEHPARHLDGDRPLGEPLDLAGFVLALDLGLAGEHAVGPGERVLEVVRRREDRVDDPVVERLLRLQHAVLLQRVRDDDLERVLDADQVRQEVRASPAGDDAEEHLGQGDRGGRGIHGAICGVQRDLESATEREPVDEGERRHAEGAELAEHVVAELRDQPRVVLRAHAGDVGQVGARGQDVLLSGDRDGVDLAGGRACGERIERLAEQRERRRAQRVGTRVIPAVVESDQREHLAGGEADVAHTRVRDDLSVGEGVQRREVDLVVVRHAAGSYFFFLPS
nr:hypothetical protein GCM10025699_26380 [Microbacterium flavescens]